MFSGLGGRDEPPVVAQDRLATEKVQREWREKRRCEDAAYALKKACEGTLYDPVAILKGIL